MNWMSNVKTVINTKKANEKQREYFEAQRQMKRQRGAEGNQELISAEDAPLSKMRRFEEGEKKQSLDLLSLAQPLRLEVPADANSEEENESEEELEEIEERQEKKTHMVPTLPKKSPVIKFFNERIEVQPSTQEEKSEVPAAAESASAWSVKAEVEQQESRRWNQFLDDESSSLVPELEEEQQPIKRQELEKSVDLEELAKKDEQREKELQSIGLGVQKVGLDLEQVKADLLALKKQVEMLERQRLERESS